MIDNNEQLVSYWMLSRIEEKYGAKFVGAFSPRIKGGGWHDTPIPVFYVANPDITKGHSRYIGFAFDGNTQQTYIINADYLETVNFSGLKLPSGTIIYSCYRNHYNEQEGLFIDGGFDYTRTNADTKDLVKLAVRDGQIITLDSTPNHGDL